MAKKIILSLMILIFIAVFAILFLNSNSVDIYLDGENISVTTHSISDIDETSLNRAICDYTLSVMNDTSTNITSYRAHIEELCMNYSLKNPRINVDSSIGADQIPVIFTVDGTSMLPTLKDGQKVLTNKTHNVHVGDIVVAESDEYGGIIKRVDRINGNDVHLVSDNKNISYEYINGRLYQIKGISTWVKISDINGVVIEY